MIILNLDEFNIHKNTILGELQRSVFIYPTDTIYGIGCDATSEKLISKIRLIKNSEQPFSVIVPNKEWIYENCEVSSEAEEWIRKLPGPYTLILKLKNKDSVSKMCYDPLNNGNSTIGVRMPNNWFLSIVYQIKKPIVTTSANITGKEFMTSLDDLDIEIRNKVDYIFYDGVKIGTPSTIINLVGKDVSIQKRTGRKSKDISFPIKELK